MDRDRGVCAGLVPHHALYGMSPDSYRTVTRRAEGTLRERASKFIGIIFPIANEEDFKQNLQRIVIEHHTARHFCFAYIIGEEGAYQRSSDAGEPSGTAGPPILRAIQGAQLTFTGVVVVRYFGGTLLGKGGLVQAYGDASRAAIANATIVERIVMAHIRFSCSFALFEIMKRELAAVGGDMIEKHFDEGCSGIARVPKTRSVELTDHWRGMNISAQLVDQTK